MQKGGEKVTSKAHVRIYSIMFGGVFAQTMSGEYVDLGGAHNAFGAVAHLEKQGWTLCAVDGNNHYYMVRDAE